MVLFNANEELHAGRTRNIVGESYSESVLRQIAVAHAGGRAASCSLLWSAGRVSAHGSRKHLHVPYSYCTKMYCVSGCKGFACLSVVFDTFSSYSCTNL
jgi:hypothetical protein